MSNNIRIEEDLLGTREVPAEAYYGVHTLRAIENFYISNNKISDIPEFVRGMVMVKKAAALANKELQTIPKSVANAIIAACDEVLNNGKCMDQFPVDVYQGGAGTSVNMNTNEVLANIGLELMGHQKGEYQYLNPNDHVNKCQSTNDAYPTGFRVAVYASIVKLIDAINQLREGFERKAVEFQDILKMGRTQLQDAVPMTLGQEFRAFSILLKEEVKSIERTAELLLEFNRFTFETFTQLVDGIDQFDDRGVNRYTEACRIGVVSGLTFIHVVVRVQVLIFTFLMTHQFQPDVGQHFVGIHVDGSARAALVDIYRELVHALTVVKDFITCGNDGIRHTLRNGLQLFVGQRRRFFYHNHATHKFRDVADFVIANVEVFNRSQSVNTIVGFSWNFPGTQQIFFDTNVV